MPIVGTFFRLETKKQSAIVAAIQESSGEVWGRIPYGGFEPTVQAYVGSLKSSFRGIEFTTETLPHPNGSPFEARWYLTQTPGVELRQKDDEDFACIYADVSNFQLPRP